MSSTATRATSRIRSVRGPPGSTAQRGASSRFSQRPREGRQAEGALETIEEEIAPLWRAFRMIAALRSAARTIWVGEIRGGGSYRSPRPGFSRSHSGSGFGLAAGQLPLPVPGDRSGHAERAARTAPPARSSPPPAADRAQPSQQPWGRSCPSRLKHRPEDTEDTSRVSHRDLDMRLPPYPGVGEGRRSPPRTRPEPSGTGSVLPCPDNS